MNTGPRPGLTAQERIRPLVERVLICAGPLNLVLLQPKGLSGDGYHRYLQLNEMLRTGALPDGDYSLVGSGFAAPLWLIGRVLGDPAALLAYYNAMLFCAGLGAMTLLLRRHMDTTLLRRFLLLLIAGSIVAASVNDFYGETFTLLGVGVGPLAATIGSRRTAIAGWVAVVLGAVNTPASLVGLAVVTSTEAVWRRRLRVLAVLLAAAGLVALEIWLRHGGYVGSRGARTIMPYSGRPGFSYPSSLVSRRSCSPLDVGCSSSFPASPYRPASGYVLPPARKSRGSTTSGCCSSSA